MTLPAAIDTAIQPRAIGSALVSAKLARGASHISSLRMSGSLKLLFPRPAASALDAVLVNTAGGVTGGDRFSIEAEAEPGAELTLTTQACERIYRAASGTGRVTTRLTVGPGARLAWLPQETILFDGAALSRSLTVDLAPDARFAMVEPLVFGREAMGETLRSGQLHDRIEITRAGVPLWRDAIHLAGDIAATLARPAVAAGARAVASLVYVGPDAEAMRDRLRALLPERAGASLIGEDLLAARLVAPDAFTLRRTLVPAIKLLNSNEIPRPWML